MGAGVQAVALDGEAEMAGHDGMPSAFAMACGYEGRAMASEGSAIFLVERASNGEILSVWAGIAGRDGIEPGVWYTLRDGKPVEVASIDRETAS